MGARGRKSAADLALPAVQSLGVRPEPPAALNDRAQDEWFRIVNSMPSNWFTPETLSILQNLCEATAECEALQLMIERVRKIAMTDDEAYDRYRKLIRDKEIQARVLLSCATKLRLTHQSSYTDKASGTAKKNGRGAKPWEIEG